MADTQTSIKATARNLIKKHRNMIAKYSSDYATMDNLALRNSIVTVNEILNVATSDWGTYYWGQVKRQIKSKYE